MIIVIEHQCWGLEHASFNAAFIDTILFAYPNDQITFFGEEKHLIGVRNILERYDFLQSHRVKWRILNIPKREETGWFRLWKEWKDFGKLLKDTQNYKYQKVIFTSITNTGILVLKIKSYKKYKSVPIIGIMHGMLTRIVGPWPHKPWNWPLNLRIVLRVNQSNLLKYVVLGESIYLNVAKAHPSLLTHFRSIDLPNFKYDFNTSSIKTQKDKITFGYIGTGNITKGIGLFAKLAQECNIFNNADFLLVGYLSSWRDKSAYTFISGVTESPLSTEEFIQRGLSLTYTINTSNPDFYKFGGCSSFIDALFLGKPGIYLRNNYIEYYFDLMGDIGYLCDSYEEMLSIISRILTEFPFDRYKNQIKNIEKGREILTPKYLAPKLKELLEEKPK